jgi:hypothetical protein
MVRLLGSLLLISGMLTLSPQCSAQEIGAAEDSQPMVLKFYDITPLVTPRQHHPFDGGSSVVGGISAGPIGGGQGGFGGGGGQMGSGGGGFFNLPVEPTQMGGDGMMARSGGAMSGGVPGSTVMGGFAEEEMSLKSYLENVGRLSISELIQNALVNESWESEVGGELITDLGNSLMIRQTEKVHGEIAKFLKQLTSSVVGSQTYRLEAWWIPVDIVDRGKIEETLAGGFEAAEVRQQLTMLQESKSGHHGVLICRERLTNHIVSGNHIPVIAGSVPVVGQGSSGDQPIVRSLFLGLMLEAKVQKVTDNAVAEDAKPANRADVTFRTMVTSRDDKEQDNANAGKIDRYSLAKEAAEGTCRLHVGRPTLVSSLSERTSAKSSPTELQLIMLLTRTDE